MKRNELRAMLLEQPYDALVLTSEIQPPLRHGFSLDGRRGVPVG